MAQLELSNIINISVSQSPAGIGALNTSNVALFSDETAVGFPGAGYKIYLSPGEVATDFGTASKTYKMAVSLFSQQPNILANSGYLVVIQQIKEVQSIAFGATPVSGSFKLNFSGTDTALINYNDSVSVIQTKLRAIPALADVLVTGSIPAGLTVTFAGVQTSAPLLTSNTKTMVDSGAAPVVITVSEVTDGETLEEAILRTKDAVQYFGIMATSILSQVDMLDAGALVQTLNKMIFFVSRTAGDVAPGGMLDLLRTGGLSQSRGLYYGNGSEMDALVMMSAYVGRGLSTNFSGSNTTQTMQLKDLIGIQPDGSMTQTLYNQCQDAGVDVYASIQGVPKVLTSGANQFFDDVYNLQWFIIALQVAGFNALAQSSTKIPQTENGVSALKSAYRAVCEQSVTNQYVAPGAWNSPTVFGNQGDFLANILQRGYYIYSLPVAQQSAQDRADRKAPLIQIAIKQAGAIHSSSVIVNVNV